jgi:hypothetical protein
MAWLQRIANAARQLNYAGTFVYQHGDTVETSRIVHLVEGASEIEKLETLDGPRREVVRTQDIVYTYHPDDKSLRVERRRAGRSFPQLLPDQLTSITEHYEIRKVEVERVGGLEAQALILEPRDGLRYGHKFWADTEYRLLLKAKMIGERNHTMELFAFTQLQIGGTISRDLLKPSFVIPPTASRSDCGSGGRGHRVADWQPAFGLPSGARSPTDAGGIAERAAHPHRSVRRSGCDLRVHRTRFRPDEGHGQTAGSSSRAPSTSSPASSATSASRCWARRPRTP